MKNTSRPPEPAPAIEVHPCNRCEEKPSSQDDETYGYVCEPCAFAIDEIRTSCRLDEIGDEQ